MNTLRRGFTLIELMVVGAIAVVILVLAAPSFQSLIEMQRLRAVSAQFATDVQFARSEAPSRQRKVYLAMGSNAAMSCYIVYTCPTAASCTPCDCTAAERSRCAGDPDALRELRTQQLPASLGVRIAFVPTDEPGSSVPTYMSFEPVTGGLEITYPILFGGPGPPGSKAWAQTTLTAGGSPPHIRTEIALSGRPSQCAPGGLVPTVNACPP
jgi:prepilin-type N-terminal cleavage/methylation domain-containing protein